MRIHEGFFCRLQEPGKAASHSSGSSMTHKSLFKEAAQRIVQLGQMSDSPPQTAGQTTSIGAPGADGSRSARAITYPVGTAANHRPLLDTLNGDR